MGMNMARSAQAEATWPTQQRSADFQSAVSQVCNLLADFPSSAIESAGPSADYKSAIQQIANLRCAAACPTASSA